MDIRWPWQRSTEPSRPSERGHDDSFSPEWPALPPLQRAIDAMQPTAPLGAFTAALTTSRNPGLVLPVQPVVDTAASLPIFAIAAPTVARRVAQPPERAPHPRHRTFAPIRRATIGAAGRQKDSTRPPRQTEADALRPEMTTAPILEEPLLLPIADGPGGGGVPPGELWTSPAGREQQLGRSDEGRPRIHDRSAVGAQVVQFPTPVMPVRRAQTDTPRVQTDTPQPRTEPTAPAPPPSRHPAAAEHPPHTPVQRSATATPHPRNKPTAPAPAVPDRYSAPSDHVGRDIESERAASPVPVSPLDPAPAEAAEAPSATSVARPRDVVTPEPIVQQRLTATEANTVVTATSGPPGQSPVQNDSCRYTEPIGGVPALEVVATTAPTPMNPPHRPVVTERPGRAPSGTPNLSTPTTSSEPSVPARHQAASFEPVPSNTTPIEQLSPRPTRTVEDASGVPVQRRSPNRLPTPGPGRSPTRSDGITVVSPSEITLPGMVPTEIPKVEPGVARTGRQDRDHDLSDPSKRISAQRVSITGNTANRAPNASEPVSEPAAQRPRPGVRTPMHETPLPVLRVTTVPAGIGAPMSHTEHVGPLPNLGETPEAAHVAPTAPAPRSDLQRLPGIGASVRQPPKKTVAFDRDRQVSLREMFANVARETDHDELEDPLPVTQRQAEGPRPTESVSDFGAPPTPGTAPPASTTGPPAGLASPNIDELARRLYEPIVTRIKTELWLDRERAGLLSDPRL